MKYIASLLFLSLICAAIPCFGQATDATLVGSITDQTSAAVPNAVIEITNTATGVKMSAKTNVRGEYRFNSVPVGRYDLTAAAPGFATGSLVGIQVILNQTATANLGLKVGAVSTVEVSEAATVIDTTTAQVQSNYTSQESRYLPMTGLGAAGTNQGVLNLSLLSAGVASGGGVGVGNGPAVGGQRPRNNNFTVEGVDNNDKGLTGNVVYLSNEATESFTLLQNQFTAEFGHSSGGQFNLAVKSGGNEIHGSIYEYFQNRNLNAQDQTLVNQGTYSNPRFDQNRLGATIGGPIIKNKWFYFGNFEYSPLGRASNPGSPVYAPTSQGYSMLSSAPGLYATNLAILKQYLPAAATSDQGTIPVAGLNIPIGTIPIVAPNYTNQYQWVVSSDYNVSERDQVKFRYINNRLDTIDNGAVLPIFYTTRPLRYHLASLNEFHTFTPSLTNELRLGFNRKSDNIVVPDFPYQGLDVFPNIYIYDLNSLDIGPRDEAPQFTIQNTYQLVDNLSWTKGAHSFKFGFDGRKLIAPQQFTQRSRGDYEYSTLDRFLRDLNPDVFAERSLGAPVYYGDQIATYFYAQDTWKVRPNVSLNLGVRYEYTTVPFGERSQSLNSISDVPGLIQFREPRAQKTAWAPRIGIAWSPGRAGTTSVRAGFGMAYDVLFDNIGVLSLPPQFSTTIDPDTSVDTPNFLKSGGILPNFQGGTSLTAAEARSATANYIADQTLPQSIQWNLGVQHVFAKDYTVEVRYLGSRGVHLITQSRLNAVARTSSTQYIPTFLQAPSAGQLAALPLTLGDLTAKSNNAWAGWGFDNFITSFQPWGNSSYHGLALQVNKRFSNGLQFVGSYTWSHNISDSDAEFFSTYLSPRRPADFRNLRAERADSAFDRRHRFTLSAVWEAPWMKRNQNWFLKNIVGNYLFTGTYTAESPEYATVQSNYDANLNGDSVDRVINNANGTPGTGSGIYAVDRTGATVSINSPGTVAYIARNPGAQYILTGPGAMANIGKNTLPTKGINNFDVSAVKRFAITEGKSFEFSASFINFFNHPQFVPGSINTVYPQDTHSQTGRNFLIPGTSIFNDFSKAYSNNPRNIVLAARIIF